MRFLPDGSSICSEKSTLRKLIAGVGVAVAVVTSSVHAAHIPMITGITPDSYYDNSGLTLGYVVEFSTDVNVFSLGYVDSDGAATPLRESHDVGIWDISGTLLGSAAVAPSDPFQTGFRYAALPTSLALSAGRYVIGAFTGEESLAAGTGGDDEPVSGSVSGATTSPFATILAGDCCGFNPGFPFSFSNGLYVDGTALAFPGIGYEQFNWVANLEYDVAAQVPEPMPWLLICTAAALLMIGRRRSRRRSPVH
jgi:hypothetical protein